jgi:phospholipase C
MARLAPCGLLALSPLLFAACSSSNAATPPPAGTDASSPGDDAGNDAGTDATAACTTGCPQSKIEHLVVLVMENKTFDVELGRYCTATTGSNPTCTDGPSCCEAGPATDPSGASPTNLDDAESGNYDPPHTRDCETVEVNGGAMDKFVTGNPACSSAHNFAYLDATLAKPLYDLVATGAIADRYFQPVIGASSGNDQYLARARWVFDDNASCAGAVGQKCDPGTSPAASYKDTTIVDLLTAQGVSFTFYAEGYAAAVAANPGCPPAPAECGWHLAAYPCVFAPGDDPFEFYDSTRDKAPFIADLSQLTTDLAGGKLPSVSMVKAIGYKSDHPGDGSKTSDAIAFIQSMVTQVLSSSYGASTLVLVTYDEGGGYFDHVTPPATNTADNQPYGMRIPLMAFGPFAKKNGVSHVTMEHSSIVKFIEWNWLGGAAGTTGQLQARDANVHNIGSILAPDATGVAVPQD